MPEDATERKNMVSQVAGWFRGVLGQKIKHLISRTEHEISRFPLTERETDFYRAGINFGHLLLDWGDECISEHNANLVGDKAQESIFTPSEEKEAVENIKNKVK